MLVRNYEDSFTSEKLAFSGSFFSDVDIQAKKKSVSDDDDWDDDEDEDWDDDDWDDDDWDDEDDWEDDEDGDDEDY
jgi:hypothetical protein